jgi:hypothetical protein
VRPEWSFLFTTLSKFSFSHKRIKWISSLYQSTSSSIKVNGKLEGVFKLSMSVRQGYPLAPNLFILTTNVLGHMLDDPKHKVEGLSIPKGGSETKPSRITLPPTLNDVHPSSLLDSR